jgi:hypothetical protein
MIETFLAQLEDTTLRLAAPIASANFDEAAGLLEARQTAVNALVLALSAVPPSGSPAEIFGEASRARLESVLAAGGRLEESLRLAQAAARQQLRELHGASFALRAFQPDPTAAHSSRVELRG